MVLFTLTTFATVPRTAAAEPDCPRPVRLYAVASNTGHLTELRHCNGFRRSTVVSRRDWRGYADVFATRRGPVTVVYAVTAGDALLAFHQRAPGVRLDRPVRLRGKPAGHRAWFSSGPGTLHAVDEATAAMPTFQHLDWPLGDTLEYVPKLAPVPRYYGRTMTGVHPGSFAETNVDGRHLRIWVAEQLVGNDVALLTGAAYISGRLPAGVTGVAGTEPDLFGLDGRGRIVLLRQEVPAGWDCEFVVTTPWEVADRSGGSHTKVVVPARGGTDLPLVAELPPPDGVDCPLDGAPWEWQ